jgi:hypothetical protein
MTQSDSSTNDSALQEGAVMSRRSARRMRALLLSMFLATLGVIAYLVAYYKFPLYTAEAYIECVSPTPREPLSMHQPQLSDTQFSRFIRGQALFVTSHSVLTLALSDPVVRDTAWYRETDQDRRLSALEKLVSSEAVEDANYIRVAASTRSPDEPHKIVNTIVSKYLVAIRDQSVAPFRDELNEYRHEQEQVQAQIALKNEQIRNFIGVLDPGNIPENGNKIGTGVMRESLLEQMNQVRLLEGQTQQLAGLMEQYTDPKQPVANVEDVQAVEQDSRVMEIDELVLALERDLAVVQKKSGTASADFAELSSRKEIAEQQLAALRAQRLHDVTEEKKEWITAAYYNSQSALLQAREKLLITQGQQSDLEQKQVEYVSMLEDRDIFLEIAGNLDRHVREIDRVVRESSGIQVRSLASGQPPEERSFPRPYMLPLAAVLPIVGVGVLGLLWVVFCRIWRWTEQPIAGA